MVEKIGLKRIESYLSEDGQCVFSKWFDRLPAKPAARVTTALTRLSQGLGDLKPIGKGVSELRIHSGSGYRVYFGQDGKLLVILLCGGTKKRQQKSVEIAQSLWADYKARTKKTKTRVK